MNPSPPQLSKDEELASYKDAVWSYLLEHCDLKKNGTLFVKFHTQDRATFEKHIKSRWKYGYHRGDPVSRNQTHLERRFEQERKKWDVREKYLLNRIRGLRMQERKRERAAGESS